MCGVQLSSSSRLGDHWCSKVVDVPKYDKNEVFHMFV